MSLYADWVTTLTITKTRLEEKQRYKFVVERVVIVAV